MKARNCHKTRPAAKGRKEDLNHTEEEKPNKENLAPAFFVLYCGNSSLDTFEIADFFPIGDRVVEGLDLQMRMMDVELDYVRAKSGSSELRLFEQSGRVGQAGWQSGELGIYIGVSGILIA